MVVAAVAPGVSARPADFHPRPELVGRVLGAASGSMVVLAAPAGYGKTWLAREVFRRWREADGDHPAWFWRIEAATTPKQVVHDLLVGLGAAPEVLHELSGRDAPGGPIRFIAGCDALPAVILDIDGAPPSKAVRTVVAKVIAELAPRTRLLLACRRPEHFSMERLKLVTPVEVIRAPDLAFGAQETAETLWLAPELAEQWTEAALGWPVACGARTEALPAHADATVPERVLDALEDYLEADLLGTLPERDAALLLKVSALDCIEPGPYQALDLEAPWSRLMNLVDSGIPTAEAHRHCDRVVLHPVLSAFLRRRCRAWMPAEHAELNHRAAEYFLATGDGAAALVHAGRIGDAVLEAEIADRAGGWRVSLVDGFDSLRTVAQNSSDLAVRYPRAALAGVYWKAQTGRVNEARTSLQFLARSRLHEGVSQDLKTIGAVIAIYQDDDLPDAEVAALVKGEASRMSRDPLLVPGGETVQAAYFNNRALYGTALPIARSAIASAERLGSRYIEFYGRWQHALALHGLGRIGEAQSAYEEVLPLVDEVFGESSNESRVVGLTAAHAALLAGDDGKADALAGDLGTLYRLHTWFDVYARAFAAAVFVAGQRGGAVHRKSVVDDFRAVASGRGLARLSVAVTLEEARGALRQDDVAGAGQSLQAAAQIAEHAAASSRLDGDALWLPVQIERARIALFAGQVEDAAAVLEPLLQSGTVRMDAERAVQLRLLGAYAALRRRRFREAATLLTECVAAAEDGLHAPFADRLNLASACLEFVGEHAVPVDAVTHRKLGRLVGAGGAENGAGGQGAPALRGGPESARLLLTQRETDVLVLLAEGLSSKEAARRLSISEGTVRTHRKHLYEKLGARRRSQAIQAAREMNLL